MGGTRNVAVSRNGGEGEGRSDVEEKLRYGIEVIGPECAVPLDAPWANMRILAEAVKGR